MTPGLSLRQLKAMKGIKAEEVARGGGRPQYNSIKRP